MQYCKYKISFTCMFYKFSFWCVYPNVYAWLLWCFEFMAKFTIKKMSRNFNSLYVVNLNLNFVSVTQPLTDHNFGTVNSVRESARGVILILGICLTWWNQNLNLIFLPQKCLIYSCWVRIIFPDWMNYFTNLCLKTFLKEWYMYMYVSRHHGN